MQSDVNSKYYVYAHYRLDTSEIFYIGKGSERRAYKVSKRKYNPYWFNIYKKHGVRIEILKANLCEKDAFEIEKALIWFYGRKDLGLGPLANMSDGGEGASGTVVSEEIRRKRSESASRYNKIYKLGSKHSDSTKQIMKITSTTFWSKACNREAQSIRCKNRPPDSEETREKKRKNLTSERAKTMAESTRTPEKRAIRSKQLKENWQMKLMAKEKYMQFANIDVNKISIRLVRQLIENEQITEL